MEIFIAAPGHFMSAQFSIGGDDKFFRKTFQIILGKTGLGIDQVEKDRFGQEKAEGVLNGFHVKTGFGARE